ncbi:hypothetical protein JF535_06150 [Microbulbifer salipaludis]|uniref:Uncharacterized protein n=1 Tax=Microbulbifer salipaludis TaxID=187980 RepID=A0ABS3E564_9GAMM|nr:hypothetical protein [Microbulbifer salipaludis]MBN8430435.1 hypothetical protein [Microbulbifer salipaludis]
MDTPQGTLYPSPQNCPVIAGQNAGKRISCVTEYQHVYDRLQQAALRNHHWARIAVKELHALTTGMLGKNNVYVRPGERQRSTGNERYYVFLPGLKATVERWPNDQYCITELVLDDHYYDLTAPGQEETRMGLYRASSDLGQNLWKASYVKDSKILPQRGRLVAIADAKFSSADDAIEETMPRTAKHLGVGAAHVRDSGADLHFTPGRKPLGGGLLCYNPLNVEKSRASALLLATTMASARDVEGVVWAADFGGSAVLTQAMQILADKGLSLKGHTVYFHKPRTSPAKSLRLAHKLQMNLNERIADTGLSLRGAISQLSVADVRLKNKNDPYSKGYHAEAWLNGGLKVAAPAGLLAAAVGGQAGLVVGGIATVIGGTGVVHALGKSAAESFGYRFRR